MLNAGLSRSPLLARFLPLLLSPHSLTVNEYFPKLTSEDCDNISMNSAATVSPSLPGPVMVSLQTTAFEAHDTASRPSIRLL
ncbi:hypothetical protein F5X98DRAFT_328228 [Xylaria grammica]|nr:hypothetical protein F5X98DRAFT_328228 [Xylaria grammica]